MIVTELAPSLGTQVDNRRAPLVVMLGHTKANIKKRQQYRNTTWTLDRSGNKMAVIAHTNKAGITTPHDIAMALRSGASHNYQTANRIRRLTPLECERLQGFPDGWTEGVSDTQRYKCLGNAVTVPVIESLGRAIAHCRCWCHR